MCTIVVMHRTHPDHPLVVAANRDEFYAREALPPRVLSEQPRVVGGVDCDHGGTWMGVNASGLFVGVTNQRSWKGRVDAPRSRGEIALEALRRGTVAGVRELVTTLSPAEYNSFNLVYGDAHEVEVAYGRHHEPRVERVALPPGVHVLANDRLGSPEFPKALRAERLVVPHVDRAWPALEPELRRALADHERPPLDAVPVPPPGATFDRELVRELQALCIHTELYGTRSSTILAIDDDRVARYLFADGPPCRTPYVDVTPLVDGEARA